MSTGRNFARSRARLLSSRASMSKHGPSTAERCSTHGRVLCGGPMPREERVHSPGDSGAGKCPQGWASERQASTGEQGPGQAREGRDSCRAHGEPAWTPWTEGSREGRDAEAQRSRPLSSPPLPTTQCPLARGPLPGERPPALSRALGSQTPFIMCPQWLTQPRRPGGAAGPGAFPKSVSHAPLAGQEKPFPGTGHSGPVCPALRRSHAPCVASATTPDFSERGHPPGPAGGSRSPQGGDQAPRCGPQSRAQPRPRRGPRSLASTQTPGPGPFRPLP